MSKYLITCEHGSFVIPAKTIRGAIYKFEKSWYKLSKYVEIREIDGGEYQCTYCNKNSELI